MDNNDIPMTQEQIDEMNARIRLAAIDAQRSTQAQIIERSNQQANIIKKEINRLPPPNDEAGPKSKIWGNNQDRQDPPSGSAPVVQGGKTRRRYKKKSRGGYKKKSRGGYKKKSRRGRK